MARRPRAHAESGFYHVILKGSGSQIIFEDDSDRRSFLSYLDMYRRAFDVRIIAWCLMSNHVHMIISDDADALSDFMHSLTSAYACKFNRRHQRTGPLFNGRFHSVAITSEGQLLNAVRYVHDKPVKGGICLLGHIPGAAIMHTSLQMSLSSTHIPFSMQSEVPGISRNSAATRHTAITSRPCACV